MDSMGVTLIVKDFDIEQTLECGQCFNFEKVGEKEYLVMARARMLHVKQIFDRAEGGCTGAGSSLVFYDQSEADVRNIWIPYFDLGRDYGEIKKYVANADPRLKDVVEEFGGIRILNQEFPETLISFIISQNKNIPQIKKIVRAICEEFGSFAGEFDGKRYYAFPSLEKLQTMTEQDFRNLKTGFRAPYIMEAIKFLGGEFELEKNIRNKSFADAKAHLTTIKGVGDKVANCVLLFSLGFRAAFPVDVWIKRIMEELYFGQDTDKKVIEAFAGEKFGKYGGYAQQYLFMYVKSRG